MSDNIESFVIYLEISNLKEVEEELDQFDTTKWLDLGLQLDISYNELKVYESNYPANNSRCLRETLSHWLTKSHKVHRTWHILAEAVEPINSVVAESIRKIMANPVSQFLQKYKDNFSKIIIPEEGVHLLVSEKVIKVDAAAKMKKLCGYSGGLLMHGPFREMCASVAEDHHKFQQLVSVLKRFKKSEDLANELDLCAHKSTYFNFFYSTPTLKHNGSQISNPALSSIAAQQPDTIMTHQKDTSSNVIKFNLGRGYQVKYDELRGKFASLIENISPLIKAIVQSVAHLKKFLILCRSELKSQLQETNESFDDVMDIVVKEISIVNITLLKRIVLQYGGNAHLTTTPESNPDIVSTDCSHAVIDKANKMISDYEKELNDFCKKESVRFLKNRKLKNFYSAQLICETIQFTVDWKIVETSLEDIKNLLSIMFEDFAESVELVLLDDIKSITIICYAPRNQMDSLVVVAQNNLDSLKKLGLIDFTIGNYTLYDRRYDKVSPSLDSEYTEDSLLNPVREVISLATPDVKYKAVPLIHPNDVTFDETTGQLVPIDKSTDQGSCLCACQAGMKLLANISDPIVVLSIAGPSYTGKTYILSRVLGSCDAFMIERGTDKRLQDQTHSIWIATHALKYDGHVVVVLLADTDASVDENQGLLALTLLLSSQFIYNIIDFPRNNDLIRMKNTIALAKSIAHPQQCAPNCLWLFRDFLRKLKDYESGRELSSKEFLLQEVFRCTDANSPHEESSQILKYFNSPDCFVLPPPSLDADVNDDIATHHNKVSSNFLTKVSKLLSTNLGSSLPLKKMFQLGDPINGQLLALLTKQYIDMLNAPKSIKSIGLDVLLSKILDEFKDLYQVQMQKEIHKISAQQDTQMPLEIEADNNSPSLMRLHRLISRDLSKELLCKLRPFSLFTNEKDMLKKYHKLLVQYEGNEIAGGVLHEFFITNSQLSRAFCLNVWSFHYQPIKQKLIFESSTYSYMQYVTDLMAVRTQYMSFAKGPAKWDVLSEVMSHLHNADNLPGFDHNVKIHLEKLIHIEGRTKADKEQLSFKEIEQNEDAELSEKIIDNMQEEMQHQSKDDKQCFYEKKKQEEIMATAILQREFQRTREKKFDSEMKKREDMYVHELKERLKILEIENQLSKDKPRKMKLQIDQFHDEEQRKKEVRSKELEKTELDILQNQNLLHAIMQQLASLECLKLVN